MRTSIERKQQGALESFGGRIKRALGALLGHERTEAEGRAQELRGDAKVEQGKAGERLHGAAEQASGAVERKIGEVSGNAGTQAEGLAREVRGTERRELNR